MELIRLQKFLSTAGVCSRRQGEKYITEGLVRVNGQLVTTLGAKVDPEKDRIAVAGKTVHAEERLIYIALNKPKGYISSCRHTGAKIVLDLIDIPGRVYPVGRLDKDSTGLLLLTNDGRLHHRLSHPSFDHEKEYEVVVAAPVSDDALRRLEIGIDLDGTTTRSAHIKRLSAKQFRIVLKEGRNRQIRRMVKQIGHRVVRLKRIRISNIRLGRLSQGAFRHLTEKEKTFLLKRL